MTAKDPKQLEQTPEEDVIEGSVLTVEEDLEGKTDKSYSQGQLVLRRFVRHKAAMISLAILIIIAIVAWSSLGIWGIPGWWKYDYKVGVTMMNGGKPTLQLWPLRWGEHPFGQETIGIDYFSLVMRGTQRSLLIALSVGLIASIIGTIIGAAAGFYRGVLEGFLMRMTDMFMIIPLLVIASVLAKMSGGNIWMLALVLGALSWTGLARLVRGEVLSLREREFVSAARAIGTPNWRIIFRHILPSSLGTIIVNTTLLISAAILLETALSFLGFGVQAPDTSLGVLINQNKNTLSTRPWLFWWPGIMIVTIALCVNFLGDGLRDAFDPRQKMD